MMRRIWRPRRGYMNLGLGLDLTLAPKVGDLFTPASVAGLYLWLDAQQADTLFQDSAKTTPATANDHPVGAWADRSGNGRDALQATAGKRPLLRTAGIGGLPAILGDATDDCLQVASVDLGTSFLVMGVTKRAANVLGMLCELGASTSAGDGAWIADSQSEAQGEGARIRVGAVDFSLDAPANWISGASAHTFRLEATNSGAANSCKLYSDDTLRGQSQGAFADFPSLTLNILSRNNGASIPWIGYLAELLIYTPLPSAGDIAEIRSYLADKWGLA